MEINGRTGFFCLIGSPVGHSGSPAMYNYSFQKTEQDYVYLAFDVDLDKTEEAVSALKALGCKGFNVTAIIRFSVIKVLVKWMRISSGRQQWIRSIVYF